MTYLHVELHTKSLRIVTPDQLYRLLIPSAFVTTLSIANEQLLFALLPAGVVPSRRFRVRVEWCSFDGRALSDVVLRRNKGEWFVRREISRLTQAKLLDVPPTTMRKLRRLGDDRVNHGASKYFVLYPRFCARFIIHHTCAVWVRGIHIRYFTLKPVYRVVLIE